MTDTYTVPPDADIVCTLRPGDDEQAGMELYRTLFTDAYVSGERTTWGVRWTFRHLDGIEDRVRTLAALEQRCCAFLRMNITVADGQVVWDVIGPNNARDFFDEYIQLPQTAFGSIENLRARVTATGLTFNDQR
jgi:hypothetical protein